MNCLVDKILKVIIWCFNNDVGYIYNMLLLNQVSKLYCVVRLFKILIGGSGGIFLLNVVVINGLIVIVVL